MRALACLLAAALAFGALAAPARCEEELPNALRVNAEHAFLDGRQQDLGVILEQARSATDLFPLVLAAGWWRRTPEGQALVASRGSTSAPENGEESVAAKRLRWAAQGLYEPPYPRFPGGGVDEPYPLISVLIEDRIQRETLGAAGLPQTSPLQRYLDATGGGRTPAEGDVIEFALAMQLRSYHGDEDPAYEQGLDKAAERQANLNRVSYLGLLGALIASGFLATLFAGRDRRPQR